MSALLRLRYALGRWLVAPVIRLPKKMTPPEIIQVTVGGKFTSPQAKPEFHLSDVEPAPAERDPDAEERALIWRDAMRLAEQGASVVGAVVDVAEARALLHATDLSPPSESAAQWDEARGGHSK